MANKEKIRKALEVIAEETGLPQEKVDKLYATGDNAPELETEDGLAKVRLNQYGDVEIESPLGPKISIQFIHNDPHKSIAPFGAVYEIHTSEKGNDGQYYTQPRVCYVDAKGLVIASADNIRINPKINADD